MSKQDPDFIEPKLEPDDLPKAHHERPGPVPPLPRLKVQPPPPEPRAPWPMVRFFVNFILIHVIAAIVFMDALGIMLGVRWLMAH